MTAGEVELDQALRRLRSKAYGAISRCHNRRDPQYRRYGARGVGVYSQWRNNVPAFVEHLTTLVGWTDPRLRLARVDMTKGYEPGNLQFVMHSELQRERRRRTARSTSDSRQRFVRTLLDCRRAEDSNRAFVKQNHQLLAAARKEVCTQAELAAIASVPQGYVSRVEQGDAYGIGAEALARMLEVYSLLMEETDAGDP
jgi:hypothetical protein